MKIQSIDESVVKFLSRENTKTRFNTGSLEITQELKNSIKELTPSQFGPKNDFELLFWGLDRLDLVKQKARYTIEVYHTYKANSNSYIEWLINKLKKSKYKVDDIHFRNEQVFLECGEKHVYNILFFIDASFNRSK